jgi:hypothetical protein
MPLNQFLVLGVVPANNEQGVAINAPIVITFSKAMDVNTLTDTNINLRKINGEYVPYKQNYSYDTYQLTLNPESLLDGNTAYQVEIIGGANGVKSITGDYTVTRDYEFTTILTKSISNPQNLILSQDGTRISATWAAPAVLNDTEPVTYNVRVSASNDALSSYLWPELPIGTEYNQAETSLEVPKDFEYSRNYYVYIQAVSTSDVSDWTIAQIYLSEPVKDTSSSIDSGSVFIEQIEILEVYPTQGGIIQDDMVFVALSDSLDSLPSNAVYVVQAPYKEKLSLIDLLTVYSPNKAVQGTVSVVAGNDSIIQWAAATSLPTNKEYVIIVSKDIKGLNTDTLGVPASYGFRSPYDRLYGDIKAIKERLGDIAEGIKDSYLYSLMHTNTLFAYQTVSNTSTFTLSDYTSVDAPYYIHQYVTLQTVYDAMLNVVANSGGTSAETYQLNYFHVQKQFDVASTITLMNAVKGEIKPWLDMVHGQNNRGYAKPTGAIKGEAIESYPDYVIRSTLKTTFDV